MEHTGRQRPQPCTDKATWDHQELEEEGPPRFKHLWRERGPAHTWISDTGLPSCEMTTFYCAAICYGSPRMFIQ